MNSKVKRNIFITLMLIYPILHLCVFFVYINFNTIALCFQRTNVLTGQTTFVGLYWIKEFFHKLVTDMPLYRSVINSLLFIPVTNFILLPLSVICSYFMFKKIPLSRVYRIVFFLPSIISIVVMTMCFAFMFDSTFGVVNNILGHLGLESLERTWLGDPQTSLPMVFLYCVWAGIGFNVILLGGAMGRIPEDVIEYGKVEGIGMWTEMVHIIIPMIWPTISTLFITGTMSGFTIFLQNKLLTAGGPNFSSSTVGLYVVDQTLGANYSWAATVGVCFSVVGIVVVLGVKTIFDHIGEDIEF